MLMNALLVLMTVTVLPLPVRTRWRDTLVHAEQDSPTTTSIPVWVSNSFYHNYNIISVLKLLYEAFQWNCGNQGN